MTAPGQSALALACALAAACGDDDGDAILCDGTTSAMDVERRFEGAPGEEPALHLEQARPLQP